MPTGRSVTTTCPARAILAGNPSESYLGALFAVPVEDLRATAAATEASTFEVVASNPTHRRLLEHTAEIYQRDQGTLPAVALSTSTSIPSGVSLGGSAAIATAALRALAAWHDRRWALDHLAALVCEAVATDPNHAGCISQAAGTVVWARADQKDFELVDLDEPLPLFVAWAPKAAEEDNTASRKLRRRFDAGDNEVHRVLAELADQATRAHRATVAGDLVALGAAMDRSFDLATSILDIGFAQRRLVEIGRRLGAAVNSAGEGGSVVGLCRDDFSALRRAYERAGASFLGLT